MPNFLLLKALFFKIDKTPLLSSVAMIENCHNRPLQKFSSRHHLASNFFVFVSISVSTAATFPSIGIELGTFSRDPVLSASLDVAAAAEDRSWSSATLSSLTPVSLSMII